MKPIFSIEELQNAISARNINCIEEMVPFYLAIVEGLIVEAEKGKSNRINSPICDSIFPIHIAIETKRTDLLKRLLNLGASLTLPATTPPGPPHPLKIALSQFPFLPEISSLLLERGISLNDVDERGAPFYYSIFPDFGGCVVTPSRLESYQNPQYDLDCIEKIKFIISKGAVFSESETFSPSELIEWTKRLKYKKSEDFLKNLGIKEFPPSPTTEILDFIDLDYFTRRFPEVDISFTILTRLKFEKSARNVIISCLDSINDIVLGFLLSCNWGEMNSAPLSESFSKDLTEKVNQYLKEKNTKVNSVVFPVFARQ